MTRRPPTACAGLLLAAAALVLPSAGCDTFHAARPTEIAFVILQMGDVEDIRPPGASRRLALIAAIKKHFLAENPQTFLVMPGDVFNPSPLANVRFAGKPVAGRNMIEVMNAVGVDFATFGNHAFDLDRKEFTDRLEESTAHWVSSNVMDGESNPPAPFEGVPAHRLIEVRNSYGYRARVGLIGLTMEGGGRNRYLDRTPPIPAARQVADRLAGKHDVLIALTHLNLKDDLELAKRVPEIHAILGGHDDAAIRKDMQLVRCDQVTGPDRSVSIFKADADAGSIWVHRCVFDTQSRRLAIDSEQIRLDGPAVAVGPADPRDLGGPGQLARENRWLAKLEPDGATSGLLDEWEARFVNAFRSEHGMEHDATLRVLPEQVVLDGLKDSVRTGPTNLTRLVALAMLRALGAAAESPAIRGANPADDRPPRVALFNSGTVRIDDLIGEGGRGSITIFDVQRIVPYRLDPVIRGVRMTGALLADLLEQGARDHAGRGGFLQAFDEAGKRPIPRELRESGKTYLVAVDDYLIDGYERGYERLGPGERAAHSPGLVAVPDLDRVSTFREALMAFLRESRDSDFARETPGPRPPVAMIPREKVWIRARTAPSVRENFGSGADGPFIESPPPLLGPIPPIDSNGFASELEESLELESEAGNRLRLARMLLKIRPQNRRAARELMAGALSDDAETHAVAREILAAILPESPPALIHELSKTMLLADEFTRADLVELLAKIGPPAGPAPAARK